MVHNTAIGALYAARACDHLGLRLGENRVDEASWLQRRRGDIPLASL